MKEGIFLVPSRVAKWEFTLFRLKCTQPFFDIFLVIMVSWSKVLENLRKSCLTFFISGLNDKIWPLTVDVFLDIFMSLVKKRQKYLSLVSIYCFTSSSRNCLELCSLTLSSPVLTDLPLTHSS